MVRFLCHSVNLSLALLASPVSAQTRYNDWQTALGDNRHSVYASTTNADGSVLMESCNWESKSCSWLLGGDTRCEDGHKAPALVNSDDYAGSITLICSGKLKDSNYYAYAFSDWKTLESLILNSKSLAIAVPIGNTQFKVFRFSLSGMTEAKKQAENVWSYMSEKSEKDQKSSATPTNSVI